MDPFSMIIGLTIAAYVVGGVAADTWAVATRQTPPSIQKSRDRHERKLARGEDSNPAPSYLGRIVGNAAERWAENSDRRHRDKMAWIEERDPHRSSRRMNRKRRNAARYEAAAQTIAAKCGQLWGATLDAVDEARQRRAEGQAHRRNATEPDLLDRDDWHPDDDLLARPERDEHPDEQEGDGETRDATVLEFTRPDNAKPQSPSQPARQSISDEAEIWGDPADPASWTGTDKFGRDIQTGEGERYTDSSGGVVHDSDKLLLGEDLSPERRIVQQHQRDLEKLSEGQADLVRRVRQSHRTREPIGFAEQDWYGLPVDLRARLLDEAVRAECAPVTYSEEGEPVRGTDLDTEAAALMQETPPDTPPAKPDPDASWVPNPYWKPGAVRESRSITQGELRRRREREDRADAATERERERAHELALAQLQTPDGEQPGPEQESLDENGDTSMAEQTEQSEQVGTAGTATGEITSLQDALTYTRTMSNRLAAIQAETDGMSAQVNRLNVNARAAVQEIEQAVADLGANEVTGQHVGKLSSAGEEMNTMAEAARQATKQLTTLSEAATSAQRGFSTAQQAFQAQTGLEEEIQTANASGNKAGKRQFYEA